MKDIEIWLNHEQFRCNCNVVLYNQSMISEVKLLVFLMKFWVFKLMGLRDFLENSLSRFIENLWLIIFTILEKFYIDFIRKGSNINFLFSVEALSINMACSTIYEPWGQKQIWIPGRGHLYKNKVGPRFSIPRINSVCLHANSNNNKNIKMSSRKVGPRFLWKVEMTCIWDELKNPIWKSWF